MIATLHMQFIPIYERWCKMHKENSNIKNSCGMCCTKIRDLSVRYGNTTVLNNVNLHIHCGEITAIIGPNGAGKSTLLKAILGVIPHSGSIIFTDLETNNITIPRIGYVPQFLDLDRSMPITVRDLFTIAGSHFPAWLGSTSTLQQAALQVLESVQATHLIDHSIGTLSGGELQRVLLALALQKQPDILLLDEPVSGVDQNGLDLFYCTIDHIRAQYDLTTILISHDFNLVSKFADRLVLLDEKILKSGTPHEVFNSKEFRDIFNRGVDDLANDL